MNSEQQQINRTEWRTAVETHPTIDIFDEEQPEDVLNSDRFIITDDAVGRGAWGAIYPAVDKRFDQPISVKVLHMSETAEEQLRERGLTERAVMAKDGYRRAAVSHILPAELHEDDNGKDFLVMPRIDGTYQDVLDRARAGRRFKTHKRLPKGDQTFESGLTLDEIADHAEQMAIAYRETHQELGTVHLDNKPDNWVYQERKDGSLKLLLNDFGTSTTVADPDHQDVRNNMGHIFTRSPNVWRRDAERHPDARDDLYAFASMLKKQFTGTYLFEDTLADRIESEGMDSAREFMTRFHGRYATAVGEWRSALREDLSEHSIPEEFEGLIVDLASQTYPRADGGMIVRDLQRAVDAYKERHVKQDAFKELWKQAKHKVRVTAGTTALFGLAIGAFGTCAKMSFNPMWDTQPELYMQSQAAPQDTRARLYLEGRVSPVQPAPERDERYLSHFIQHIGPERIDKNLASRVAHAYVITLADLGAGVYEDAHHRSMFDRTRAGAFRLANQETIFDFVEHLTPIYLQLNMVDAHGADAEDFVVELLYGTETMRKAKRIAGDDWSSYRHAQILDREGDRVSAYSADAQRFVDQMLFNLQQTLPGSVAPEQDSR